MLKESRVNFSKARMNEDDLALLEDIVHVSVSIKERIQKMYSLNEITKKQINQFYE